MNLFRCNECGHRMSDAEVLTVHIPHPKPGKDAIPVSQCPECGAVEQFTAVCDESGCRKDVSCGWPSPEGYRNTCHDHRRMTAAPIVATRCQPHSDRITILPSTVESIREVFSASWETPGVPQFNHTEIKVAPPFGGDVYRVRERMEDLRFEHGMRSRAGDEQ